MGERDTRLTIVFGLDPSGVREGDEHLGHCGETGDVSGLGNRAAAVEESCERHPQPGGGPVIARRQGQAGCYCPVKGRGCTFDG